MLKAVDDFKDVESVSDARHELGVGPNDKLVGMSVQLLAHQVIGVNWMIKQENLREDHGIGPYKNRESPRQPGGCQVH